MTPNWNEINKCPIWKVLGVTECNNCSTCIQCWGEEIELEELEQTQNDLKQLLMENT